MIQLLTLTIAGRTWRLASKSVDVDSAAGLLRYRGGLPTLDVEQRVDLLSSGSPASLSTDLLLPFDLSALQAAGYSVGGSVVEIAYLQDGDEWEQRAVALRGRVASASSGLLGQVARIEIESELSAGEALYPGSQDDIRGEGVWSVADADIGKGYPTVLGNPGVYRGSAVAATPAVVIGTGGFNYAIISGESVDSRTSSTFEVFDLTGGTQATSLPAWLTRIQDFRGRWVSALNLLGYPFGVPAVGTSMAIGWTGAGGRVYRGSSHDRAGDVLRWSLERSGLPVDWRHTEPACRSLPWVVGGYWDASCSPWEWARNNLLTMLPVSAVYGADGVGLVRLDRPDPSRVVATFRDGLNCCFSGRTREVDNVINSATLRYVLGVSGEAKTSLTLSADRPAAGGMGRSTSARARRAQGQIGAWDETSGLVWSDVTAGQIVQAQLALRAPRSVVTVDAPISNLAKTGDHVRLESTRYDLSTTGIVRGIRVETSRIKAEIVVYSRA